MTDNQTPQHDENHLIAERRSKLAAMTRHVAFADVEAAARAILDGGVRGRVVVDIG